MEEKPFSLLLDFCAKSVSKSEYIICHIKAYAIPKGRELYNDIYNKSFFAIPVFFPKYPFSKPRLFTRSESSPIF